MTTLATLHSLIAQGESEKIELKQSIAKLRRVGETRRGLLTGERGVIDICGLLDGTRRNALRNRRLARSYRSESGISKSAAS